MQDYHIYTAQPIVCTLCNHVSGPSSVEPTDNKTQNLLRSLHSIELRGTGPYPAHQQYISLLKTGPLTNAVEDPLSPDAAIQ